jgi:hypothetical protein
VATDAGTETSDSTTTTPSGPTSTEAVGG